MAKCTLNGVTLDEVKRNASNAYAAGIESGEIFTVEGCHSKNGNPMLRVIGKNLRLKDFNGSTFIADGCILYNPPLIKAIIDLCDDSESSLHIIKGVVSKTAPSTTTSDTVVSKTDLQKEREEIQKGYFNLKGAKKEAADARLAAIETQLKTA